MGTLKLIHLILIAGSVLLTGCKVVRIPQGEETSEISAVSALANPIPKASPNLAVNSSPTPMPTAPLPKNLPTFSVPPDLNAVIEVLDQPWYAALRAPGKKFANTSLARYYAPHAVFFEGWKSGPRALIEEYKWNFGDGSPAVYGFNAAHVFETPGVYPVTLTVTTALGASARAHFLIEVLARDGKTYYVDSKNGNDSNSGLAENAAWKTATFALAGINRGAYLPGDRILFKRGLEYDLEAGVVKPGHYAAKHGYLFGAYGTGARPKIMHVGASTEPLLNIIGMHFAFVTFQDLEFDGLSSTGALSSIYNNLGQSIQILFHRVVLKNFYQGITAHAETGPNAVSNLYIMDCELSNGELSDADYLRSNVHFYGKVSRMAVVRSKFDKSNNHLGYVSWASKFVAYGNEFARAASGRTFLRIAAASGDFLVPSDHLYVGFNAFKGWIDPYNDGSTEHAGKGLRYNMTQLHLGPNVPEPQGMLDALIENNSFLDAETFISIGSYEDALIRRNVFSSQAHYPAAPRIALGVAFERRPLKGIRIVKNQFTNTVVAGGGTPQIFRINTYDAAAYLGQTRHEAIEIAENEVFLGAAKYRFISFEGSQPEAIAEVRSNHNILHTSFPDQKFFQLNGTYNVSGTLLNLLEWQNTWQQDTATLVIP